MLMLTRYLVIGLVYADFCLVANIISGEYGKIKMPLYLGIIAYFTDFLLWPIAMLLSDIILPIIREKRGE